MLSSVEIDYLKSLILAYKKQGYNYYLCHTVTNYYSDVNDYDLYVYFSKDPIEAITSDHFYVPEGGIEVQIDSSSKSNNNTNDSVVSFSYSGDVVVDVAEFTYTNAKLYEGYSVSSNALSPDIVEATPYATTSFVLILFVVMTFLYIYIRDLLNIGGS